MLRIAFLGGFLLAVAAAIVVEEVHTNDYLVSMTLREYMMPTAIRDDDIRVYLAMGPAFFGFYGYFGALAGMEDALFGSVKNDTKTTKSLIVEHDILQGVSGASAGAMAAILLAAGISPHSASLFVSSLGLSDFADPGGFGAILKGNRFESIMADFLRESSPIVSSPHSDSNKYTLDLQQALIPVAVSTVDIQPQIPYDSSWMVAPWRYIASMYMPTPKILTQGSMARAARASACFPGLFQPVGWIDRSSSGSSNDNTHTTDSYSLLIDGGIFDWAGYNGLRQIIHADPEPKSYDTDRVQPRIRILNMVVGGFGTVPPGPASIAKSLGIEKSQLESVFSISIEGLPSCGPLSMGNGPIASEAARVAMMEVMDQRIVSEPTQDHSSSSNHYVLRVDASTFTTNEA